MYIHQFLRIYIWNSKLNISRCMEYRLDFFIGLIVNLLLACAGPVFQYLLFSQVNGYPGWSIQEIILFQGILLVALGLKTVLTGNVAGYVESLIRQGSLDRLLLRPYSSIGMILANGFSLDGIGTVAAGVVISMVTIIRMRICPPVYVWLMTLFAIGMGLVLFIAFDILLSCVMIRLVNIGRLNEIFNSIAKFGQYPLELYPKWVRLLFLSVVPFAIWVNIPCRILLEDIGKYMIVPFLVVFVFLGLSLYCWNGCIKHYSSAGG